MKSRTDCSFLQTLVQSLATLSALFTSVVVSYCIERFGGMLGGFFASFPLLHVIDSLALFIPTIIITQDIVTTQLLVYYRSVFLMVPLGLILNAAYLYLWSVLPPILVKRFPRLTKYHQVAIMAAGTLTAWAAVAVLVSFTFAHIDAVGKSKSMLECITISTQQAASSVFGSPADILFAPAVFALGVAIAVSGYLSWNPRPTPRGTRRVGQTTVIIRASLTVLVRVSAYATSHNKHVPPPLVGFLLTAPLVMTATVAMVMLHRGPQAVMGTIAPILLGQISGSVYYIFSAILLACMDWAVALGLALLIAVLGVNLPGLFYMRGRRRVASRLELLAQQKSSRQDLDECPHIDPGLLHVANVAAALRGKMVLQEKLASPVRRAGAVTFNLG